MRERKERKREKSEGGILNLDLSTFGPSSSSSPPSLSSARPDESNGGHLVTVRAVVCWEAEVVNVLTGQGTTVLELASRLSPLEATTRTAVCAWVCANCQGRVIPSTGPSNGDKTSGNRFGIKIRKKVSFAGVREKKKQRSLKCRALLPSYRSRSCQRAHQPRYYGSGARRPPIAIGSHHTHCVCTWMCANCQGRVIPSTGPSSTSDCD
ncbi:hypothetical protein V6N11_064841 [Hibiscus sabdariffa]|uniref:Uncharacterized protein n=1 Tax=Hibiscus sabdariffa TaxID=183260 RepID=A0ABR2SIZ6_9ROSI